MKSINTLRLGAREYDIKWDAAAIRKICEERGEDGSAAGAIDHETRIVYLDPGYLSYSLPAFEVLLHEAMHIIEAFMGLDWEEGKVEGLAANIASLLIQSGFIDLDELEVGGIRLNRVAGIKEDA